MNIQNQIENAGAVTYSKGMVNREYIGVYKKRGKWFVGWIKEVPGANTQGKTLKEMKENLREALILILEENQKMGKGAGEIQPNHIVIKMK